MKSSIPRARNGVALRLAVTTLALLAVAGVQAQTPPVVVFQEVASSLDPLFTRPVEPREGPWRVEKFIGNQTGVAWTDFHITLQVLQDGVWIDSPDSDGISFDQPTPFAQWLNSVRVDINGVFLNAGWTVVRTNQPFDMVDFFFDDFVVPPGATLSLHFDMFDTVGTNVWRLKQVPTIPEPQTYALFALGIGGLALALRRGTRRDTA